MSGIYFSQPFNLGQFAREIRDGMTAHGWNAKYCCVGWHDNRVKLADDNGEIEYIFCANGRISRRHHGSPCKFIELVDIDVSRNVDRHNAGMVAS